MEATPSLSHAAERDTVGDTRGLVRRRFPVGAASQHQPASRDRSHSVRLARRFWRMLPWEFPPWQTVYGYFPPWRDQGSWKRIHRYLRGWCGSRASVSSPPGWPWPIRSRCRWAASPTGQEALMAASGSKGASATCWWTAWGCS
ncbi:MAG: hypothetical protein BRC46_00085 [Cyanobacteria bacterium QS_6_48_18]|nr:MAG: hypothetical protein BRC46_00085 [Cyanobacteria bacterium QS_6_48_18]